MNVEIRILSGPGQGSSRVFESQRVLIGDGDNCDVQYDSSLVPEAVGRCVEICLTGDGWELYNLGGGEIRVNQDIVTGSHRIKPGDVIRLSENGPDYSFGLLRPGQNTVDEATDISSPQVVGDAVPTTPDAVPTTPDIDFRTARRNRVLAVGFVVVVLLVTGLFFFRSTPQPEAVMEIVPIAVQKIREEEAWSLDVQLQLENIERSGVRFMLTGNAPEGMKIDSSSGQIKWTPSEKQGPGQYRVTITASGGESLQATTSISVEVLEANHPPVIEPIPTIVLTEEEEYQLDYTVRVSDPDEDSSDLLYQFKAAPDGMKIDQETGRITWAPSDAQLGATYTVTVEVREVENPNMNSSLPFLVRSVVVQQRPLGISEAIYLLTLTDPKDNRIYPMANAVAISSDSLVTTAVVAHELQRMKLTFLLGLPASGATGLTDGESFTVSKGATSVTFELDSDASVVTGNTAITFAATDTLDEITDTIVSALGGASLGLAPEKAGSGVVHLGSSAGHDLDASLAPSLTASGQAEGFKVSARVGGSTVGEPVLDFLVHESYDKLIEEPKAQLYVDVAIVTLQDRGDRAVVELAGDDELKRLEDDVPLRFLMIEHDGGSLTRFDDTSTKPFPARLYGFTNLVEGRPSPALLAITAELPPPLLGRRGDFGSAIFLDGSEKLIAIFAESAFIPEDNPLSQLQGRLHYAPTLFLVRDWLENGLDVAENWSQPMIKPIKEKVNP
jgi:hypothetical protein